MAKRKREFDVTLTCKDCGIKRLFTAEDVNQFFKAVELAGWHDSPEAEPHSGEAICPECYQKGEQEPK